jgi:lysophospholipase L1-like esterase
MSSLIIWNQALTQAQATIVRESLYTRYLITPSRSRRSSKSVTVVGDSIAIDYVTLGNYGWSKRLADKFPDTIRFMNYAVPGSQVTASIGTPVYGHTEGMFPISVARQMSYSKVGKNVLMILAGGNDMINVADFNFSFAYAVDNLTVFKELAVNAQTEVGENILHFNPAVIMRDLTVGALIQGSNIPVSTFVTAVNFDTGIVTMSNPVTFPVFIGTVIRFNYHNLVVGSRVQFLTLPTDSLGNPTVGGVAFSTIYYVKQVPNVYTYTLAATPSGPVIDIVAPPSGVTGPFVVRQYTKTAADIFGTPTTHGLQKVVAMANAAGASKVYMLTVLPRVGIEYNFILPALNSLIMGGGAGGYTAIDSASLPALANNVPPGTQGPGYYDSGHLNEVGSQALADFLYPTLNAYLNS